MNNYKLIFFCQRCQKEHDRTHSPMFETGVKCDCGGFVITPSGRTTMQIKLTAEVFIVKGDKYIAWIGAHSAQEATDFFEDRIKEDFISISKLSFEEIGDTKFAFNPQSSTNPDDFVWLTAKELLVGTPELPFMMYGVEIELFEEAKRRKENGEL